MGCIFLEILLWVFNRYGQKDDFKSDRLKDDSASRFWCQPPARQPALCRSVVERIGDLNGYITGRTAFKSLLELTVSMLALSPRDRPSANDVLGALKAITTQTGKELEDNANYYQDNIPSKVSIAAPPTMANTAASRLEDVNISNGLDGWG